MNYISYVEIIAKNCSSNNFDIMTKQATYLQFLNVAGLSYLKQWNVQATFLQVPKVASQSFITWWIYKLHFKVAKSCKSKFYNIINIQATFLQLPKVASQSLVI